MLLYDIFLYFADRHQHPAVALQIMFCAFQAHCIEHLVKGHLRLHNHPAIPL